MYRLLRSSQLAQLSQAARRYGPRTFADKPQKPME